MKKVTKFGLEVLMGKALRLKRGVATYTHGSQVRTRMCGAFVGQK